MNGIVIMCQDTNMRLKLQSTIIIEQLSYPRAEDIFIHLHWNR